MRRDRDVVDPVAFGQRLTLNNSEACNRIGRWASMTAASIGEGAADVLEYVPADLGGMTATGLPEFRRFLESTDGQNLIEAKTHLNDARKKARDQESVSRAMTELFMTFHNTEVVAAVQRMARFGARLYTMSFALLEGAAVFTDWQRWAAELHKQAHLMPRPVQDFVHSPETDEALLSAAVACYQAQVQEHQAGRPAEREHLSDEECGGNVVQEHDDDDVPAQPPAVSLFGGSRAPPLKKGNATKSEPFFAGGRKRSDTTAVPLVSGRRTTWSKRTRDVAGAAAEPRLTAAARAQIVNRIGLGVGDVFSFHHEIAHLFEIENVQPRVGSRGP